MNYKLKYVVAASAASVLAFSAVAENKTTDWSNTSTNWSNPSDRNMTNNAAHNSRDRNSMNASDRSVTNRADNAGRNAGDRDSSLNASDRSLTNNADNTGRNVRDRDNQTATPFDQGNNKADLDTTAQIRKEIVADKNMSVAARNVKVITNGGKVTLRGPVNTAEEKRLIGEIANRAAQVGNVDNQLEVKVDTSRAD